MKLLADNGGCRLPCLWGITPGKTSFDEARAILTPLSSLSPIAYLDPPSPGGISLSYFEGDLEIYSDLRFLTYPENETVSDITFNTEARRSVPEGYENIFDEAFFNHRIRAYMLPNVLAEQGIPAMVLISTLATPPTRGGQYGFDMVLLYPDQGILAHYSMPWRIRGNSVLGCPSIAHVELELYPSGRGDIFFDLLAPTSWPMLIQNNYRPLDDVTSISLEEFYQIYRESANQCIETPASLWPIPEP